MTLIIDSNEKDEFIKSQADEVMALDDIEQSEDDGTPYTYDACIVSGDADKTGDKRIRHAQRTFRGERKTLKDFMGTWGKHDGRLERQLAQMDFLIFEMGPLSWAEGAPERYQYESEESYQLRLAAYDDDVQKALLHLDRISANMWVVFSNSPQFTVRFYRWLERNGHDLSVKPNKIKTLGSHPLLRMIDSLPHVDMQKPLPDGRLVGEAIAEVVDREGIIKALNFPAIVKLDLAQGRMGRHNIGLGTAERIVKAMRAPLPRNAHAGSQEPVSATISTEVVSQDPPAESPGVADQKPS